MVLFIFKSWNRKGEGGMRVAGWGSELRGGGASDEVEVRESAIAWMVMGVVRMRDVEARGEADWPCDAISNLSRSLGADQRMSVDRSRIR